MTKKIDRPLDDEDGMAYGGAAYADVPKIRDIPTGDNEAYFRRLINYSFAVNQLYNPKVHDNRPDPFRPTYSPIPYGRAEGGRVLEDDFPSHYMPGVGRQVMQDGGTAADIEASIRAAQDIASRKGMEHERGVSGVVEFAPVNIREPLTGYSAQVATLPKDTARFVEPALQTAADVGPYFTPAAPIAAARDVAVGLREGDPEAVAMSAFGLPGKTAKALAVGASALMPDEAQAGIVNKALNAIRAYHGSPHKFDKFDISKIGTGEGAQAYGHGLYFAENPATAQEYRSRLAGRPEIKSLSIAGHRVGPFNSFDYSPKGSSNYENLRSSLFEDMLINEDALVSDPKNVQKLAADILQRKIKDLHQEWPEALPEAQKLLSDINRPGGVGLRMGETPGSMYEVDIHADPSHMLDWDKPLSEQHPNVINSISDVVRAAKEDAANPFSLSGNFQGSRSTEYGNPEKYKDLSGAALHDMLSRVYGHEMQSNELRNRGIPGIRYLDAASRGAGEGTSNYVVFDPNIIEILRRYMSGGRVEMADGGDPNAAETSQPGIIDQALKVASYFNPVGTAQAGPINKALDVVRRVNPIGMHSPSAAAVEAAMKQEKGPASQMIGSLKNLPGVKPEELHWSGIHSAFDPGETVTRQQIMDYLHSNLPKVEETVLGSPDESKLNAADAAVRAAIRAHNEAQATPRYYAHNPERSYASSFFPTREEAEAHATTLPEAYHAGMNIVEHQGNPLDVYETMRRLHAGEYPTNLPASVTRPALSLIDERSALEKAAEGSATKFGEYTIPGGQNYREVLLRLQPKKLSEDEARRILGAKPDAVLSDADINYATRKSADEYRSQHWDQPNVLGHLRMSDRTGPEGEKVLHLEELQSDWGQAGRKKGFALGPGKLPEGYTVVEIPKRTYEGGPQTGVEYAVFDPTKTQVGLYAPTREEAINSAIGGKFGVPTAPYVSSPEGKHTSSWVDLGLKRALKEAAEGGYNKLVWTPGEEQAARYDLSKHIDELHWNKGNLVAYDKNGNKVIQRTGMSSADLPELVGKDVAEKLLSQEVDYAGWRSLEGQGLSVGGEGMKGFYDKILPTQLQKIIKKLDPKAKIEMSAHDLPAGHGEEGVKGHVLHITPELREAIMKGLPAFAEGGDVGASPSSTVINAALDVVSNLPKNRKRGRP